MKLSHKKANKLEKQYRHRIYASPKVGLTSEQAIDLSEAGYSNKCVNTSYKTIGQIVFDNVFTFFNFVFFTLGFCLFLAQSYKDMLFLIIIVANTMIGIVQQIRSKLTIDKLTLISSAKSTAIRDGKKQTVLNDKLVRDDIIILSTGNQIPADATLVDGEIQVDESLLTGESDPISKVKGKRLLSGSFVLSGNCKARLDKVGEDSYASNLAIEAKKNLKTPQSDMMASLDKLIRVIGFAIIPIGLILFFKQAFVINLAYDEAIVTTVAALIGMIPEGLYLLTSIALAVSVMKLVKTKTLVHEMSCIETLARVDVLCVDKTGTITEPEMKVTDIIPLNDNKNLDINTILHSIMCNLQSDNSTSRALKKHFDNKTDWKAKKIHHFLSSTKWSAVEFENNGTYVIGAPEFILNEKYNNIENQVIKYLSQGTRVLLLAKLNGSIEKNILKGEIIPICLVLIDNPVRKEAPETFKFFEKQGVDIKVISGDNPITVSRVSKKAGIKNSDKYIDATTLKTDDQMRKAINNYTVFGRVTPNQKRKFIQLIKENKHTVAMTGDGVNDVLALKDADVGIAMASGSDAANQAAELVLLDSNFASMPKVVMEGRRVINNIERAAELFLVKNIFSFLLSIITIFANIAYPVTPLQLSLISALTIGIPSFFLTIEPTTSLIHGRFIRNVLRKALPGGICSLLLIIFLQMYANIFNLSFDELSTMATVLLATNGILVLLEVCRPFNWKRLAILISMAVLMIISIVFFGKFFSIDELSTEAIIALSILMILNYPLLRLFMLLFSKISSSTAAFRKSFYNRIKK